MGKIKENLLTKGFSGRVGGEMVFRQVDGETMVMKRPKKRELLTPKQQAVKDRFMDSVFYAKSVLGEDSVKEFYELAKKQFKAKSAYAAAVADYLSEPKIVRINTENYKGNVGNAIYVVAENNAKLYEVQVEIFRADNTLVESGVASVTDDYCRYEAKIANPDYKGGKVVVTAKDRPGKTALLESII